MAEVKAGGENHRVYKKTDNRGKGNVGDIIVDHTDRKGGPWDVINLTQMGGTKTIAEGIKATKDWHKIDQRDKK